jgi:hypothetical protein
MDGAGQHEDRRGAGSHHPGGDPRRPPRPGPAPRPGPGPAPPRNPASTPPRLTRGHRSRRSQQSHRRNGRHRNHGSIPQPRHQFARRRPPVRLLSQAPAHQRPQFTRQPAEVRRAVDQPVHEQSTRPGPERPLSASRVHHHRGQAEDVTRRSRILTQSLLRGHEPRRHEPRRHEPRRHEPRRHEPRRHEPRRHEPRRQHIRAKNSARPEPRYPRPILRQQDVRGVEIPVHQPRVVNGEQPRG